ncbi:MAG: methyltransferase [Clostridia bacterium]|nr:methyltransferase [Clostridia bacterium]
MEKIEDLLINNLKIVQDDELYCFTSDAILLSRFATVKKNDVVADFCAGSGVVGIHLLGENGAIKSLTLFEMQTPLYELSKKTIALNRLDDKVKAVNTRIQDIGANYNGAFSLIVCNPPYMESGRGENNLKREIAVCRTEITVSLSEICLSASKALKFGGRFAIVNRADRLCDVIDCMRKNNIEPKRLAFVKGGKKEPYLLLIEGVKGGKKGIKVYSDIEN